MTWPSMLIFMSVMLGTQVEIGINSVAAKIQCRTIRKLVYWLLFLITRYCICMTVYLVANTIDTSQSILFIPIPKTDQHRLSAILLWRYGGCCIFLGLSILMWGYIYFLLTSRVWLGPWVEKIFLQTRWKKSIWLHQLKILDRHRHMPIRDIFHLIPLVFCRLIEISRDDLGPRGMYGNFLAPYQHVISTVITLDFEEIDDPTWPDRSLLQSIMLFACASCTKDDGIYLVTTSLLRHKISTRYLGRSNYADCASIEDIQVNAVQRGGFIFIKIWKPENQMEIFIHNARQGTTRVVDVSSKFRPYVIPWCFFADDGSDWGDHRDESSIFVRAPYGDYAGASFCYGHCLLKISADNRIEKKIMEEIDYPIQWWHSSDFLFQISNGLGICAKVIDSNEIRNWNTFAIYDLKSRRMKAMRNIKAILMDDLPIRSIAQRYFKRRDINGMHRLFTDYDRIAYSDRITWITSNLCLDDRQAIIVSDRSRWIWTTRFQPATLKFMCLREIFASRYWQDRLSKLGAEDWSRKIGINNMETHFPDE